MAPNSGTRLAGKHAAAAGLFTENQTLGGTWCLHFVIGSVLLVT